MTKDWKKFQVAPEAPLMTVLEAIDKCAQGFALVCASDNTLLGVVTDGDIRRGLLRRQTLEASAQDFMSAEPVTLTDSHSVAARSKLMLRLNLTFLPIVDTAGRVVDIHSSDWLPGNKDDAVCVVLMAGGLGSRLGVLTEHTPKPLLPVNGEPIIERVVKQFRTEGFKKFIVTVKYKAEMIVSHLGDGSDLGVTIDYIHEPTRLGTAGALSMIDRAPFERLIVYNSDVLCSTSFNAMLRFHLEQDAIATMAARQHPVTIPFGVIDTDGVEIKAQKEKPVINYLVNAGFYILESAALGYVPENTFFDMPELFEKMRLAGNRTVVYPTHDKWIDIGRPEDFEAAARIHAL